MGFLLSFWRESEREEKETDMDVLPGLKGGFGEMTRFGSRERGRLHGEGKEREEEKWR